MTPKPRKPKNALPQGRGTTWRMKDLKKRSKKYWKKYDEKNPSRRIRGAQGNPTKGS